MVGTRPTVLPARFCVLENARISSLLVITGMAMLSRAMAAGSVQARWARLGATNPAPGPFLYVVGCCVQHCAH